jgi:hemerythrin-like domain-containing protein
MLETLHGLEELYQNHIWKEDAMVFPMADKVLTEADQTELSEKFGEVDRAVGLDVVARLETFAMSVASVQAPLPSAAPSGGCDCGCGS